MESVTGGFRARRSHVKAVKGGSPYSVGSCSRGFDSLQDERTDSPESLPEFAGLGIMDTLIRDADRVTQRPNQEILCEQEKEFNSLREAFVKEHRNLQARERSIILIEHTLENELHRITQKERMLDARILEITRLEARLHEALLKQENQLEQEPQQLEPVVPDNDLADREAILDLREKKLPLLLAQAKDKERHLNAKERVLKEQEAELTSFRAELERKGRDVEARLKLLEDARIQQMTSVEATTLELNAQRALLNNKEAGIAYREQALSAQATAREQFQRVLAQNHECSLMAQEDTDQGNKSQDNDRVQPQRLKRKGTLGRFFK